MYKVYFETGIFFDFLKPESMSLKSPYGYFFVKNISRKIRQKNRGKRTPSRLYKDAKKLFEKVKDKKINGVTSILTLIELEERIFETSKKIFKGMEEADNMSILVSRDLCKVFTAILKTHNIKLVGINKNLHSSIYKEKKTRNLKIRDSSQLISAKENNCNFLCSSDKHFHKLKYVKNNKNRKMLCTDSDSILKKV